MRTKGSAALYLVATGALVVGFLPWATDARATSPRPINVAFTIRLEDQFLATLRYLPVAFVPATTTATTTTTTTTLPSTSATTTTTSTTTTTLAATSSSTTTTTLPSASTTSGTTALVRGTFLWRFPTLPAVLRAQWQVGTDNVILQGALMRFQSVEGLNTTGFMNAATWQALEHAVAQQELNPDTYNVVVVNKLLPETLMLYQNGRVTLTTLVNTGVAEAPTVDGVYPVYLRFTSTTMSGIMPDGMPYHDTGIPWVSYFNGGDALHGFIRASYGWPQSLGCVEMPFTHAATLWPHTPIGTLVVVQ